MKLIIAGSRTIHLSVSDLDTIIQTYFDVSKITEVVSGKARGIDQTGIDWAVTKGIPVTEFIPDWSSKGKAAGHIRNREMGDYADEALVIYNGSSGSQGMIDYMKHLGKNCIVVLFPDSM